MTLRASGLLFFCCLCGLPAVGLAQPPGVPPPPLVPPAAGGASGVDDQQLQELLGLVQAELAAQGLDSASELDEPAAGVETWPDLGPAAALAPIREVVHPPDRSLEILVAPLRHTTLMLQSDERIVDIVVGDAVFFEVTGADNVAFIKPLAVPRRTSLTFTTNFDRTYAFDVFATDEHRPDEVVRVLWELPTQTVEGPIPGTGLLPGFADRDFRLTFVPQDEVRSLRRQISDVRAEHSRVEAEAAQQLRAVEELADQRYDEFLRAFPRRIEMRYRLSPEIQSAPLFVHQLFTDGQFTYAVSAAQESPAFFALTGADGSEPRLINYDLTPDGLYVIDHVVSAGFAQLHGARGEWHVWDVPPLTLLPEVVSAGLPEDGLPPRWIRAGAARSWSAKHPKLLRWLVGSAIAGTVTMAIIF